MSSSLITARVNHALARGHSVLAVRAWTKKQMQQTGAELNLASHYAECAAHAFGPATSALRATIAAARTAGEKLRSEMPCSLDEIHGAISPLSDAIDELGCQLGAQAASTVTLQCSAPTQRPARLYIGFSGPT